MAFRLSPPRASELRAWQNGLRRDRERIEAEFAMLRAAVRNVAGPLNALIVAHNGRLAAAREFVAGLAAEFRDDYDGRSDAWKDGERGQAAESFVSEWEDAALDDVEPVHVLLPDPPEWHESLDLPEEADQ